MHFQRPRAAAALLVCALVLIAGAYVLRHRHLPHPVKPGDPAPTLSVSDLAGAPMRLSATHGVTVYNVFTSWCPSCKEETPELARAAERLRARGVRVIGIDQGESAGAVAAFTQKYGIRYPIVLDTAHQTNVLLGARVIPETVVVKDGIVTSIAVGPITPDELDRMIGTV